MIRPLELAIGLRYTRARRRNHFISFISLTSMFGIILGVWALITVLSIMNGFERELRDRILGVASHVTVTGPGGWLDDWKVTEKEVAGHAEVLDQAPFIMGQGMVSRGSAVSGVIIRGVLPETERDVAELVPDKMVQGSFDDLQSGSFNIIIGKDLAWRLGVGVGEKISLVAPQGTVTPAGMVPRMKRFTISGLFEIGMYEYDSGLALIHLDDAAKFLKSRGRVSGLRLKIEDVYRAPLVRRGLQSELGDAYSVGDWTREHANFFRALKIEKRVMFIILLLIVAVAAFNIVSTLVMMVIDKQSDIAILRTLGLSPASVMGVFVIQGAVIGIIGTIIGAILGVLTALNVETLVPAIESLFSVEFFPEDVYVISDFPAELHRSDVIRVVVAACLMSLVATLYPAWRASRTHPADALRYE